MVYTFVPVNYSNLIYTMQTPKTVDQFRKSGERATMEDSLILIECSPRKPRVEPVIDYIEFEPWTGKDEPSFQVQPPNPRK